MVAPLGSTLGAAGDGELLGLRSKLGIPSAANDQSGRLASAQELPVPGRAFVEPWLRYAGPRNRSKAMLRHDRRAATRRPGPAAGFSASGGRAAGAYRRSSAESS